MRLETFVDEEFSLPPLDKIKRVKVHASFAREFSPTGFPFSLAPPFLFFFFLFYRFTSRHRRPGQIRIHCRISWNVCPKRGNCLLPRATNLSPPPLRFPRREVTDKDRELEILKVSYDFGWFLLLLLHSEISISRGSALRGESKWSWKTVARLPPPNA